MVIQFCLFLTTVWLPTLSAWASERPESVFSFFGSCDWMWLLHCYWGSGWSTRDVKHASSRLCLIPLPEMLLALPIPPFSVLQISYASSSASLNDEDKYMNTFRTIPDNANVVPAIASLINLFGWRQVQVLTQQLSATEKVHTCNTLVQKFTYYLKIIAKKDDFASLQRTVWLYL